ALLERGAADPDRRLREGDRRRHGRRREQGERACVIVRHVDRISLGRKTAPTRRLKSSVRFMGTSTRDIDAYAESAERWGNTSATFRDATHGRASRRTERR